jgi:hypothetical protein
MKSWISRVIGAWAMVLGLSSAAVTEARQTAISAPTGTAALAGVITEAGSHHPVKHATISVQVGAAQPRTINTDDNGRFAFGGLAAGRYVVYVWARGYVPAQYGASAPERPGAAIVLGDGQRIDHVDVTLVRCAAISGVISVQTTERVELAVELQKWTHSRITGQRTLGSTGVAQAAIDDRGVYRLHDVPPGTYFVVVNELQRSGPHSFDEGVVSPTMVTHSDVQAVLLGGHPSSAQPNASGQAEQRTIWAPTFFPGTTLASNAEPITVGPGEERAGVDVTLRIVPASTVSGTIVPPPGVTSRDIRFEVFWSDPERTSSSLVNTSAGVADDWTFHARGLRPGRYVVTAHVQAASLATTPGAPPATTLWWAEEPIVIDGHDIPDLTLTLQPGIIVSGRVQFSPSAPDAATLARVRIGLNAVVADGRVSVNNAAASIDATGRFTIGGVTPGRYRFELRSVGGPPAADAWWLESAVVNDRNAADAPIEIEATGSAEPLLTITNGPRSQLSGTVRTAAGETLRDATVILFSTDRAYWPAPSRRVMWAQPGVDGSFTLANVVSGDYFVAALGQVERNQWLDATFLDGLATGATRVTVREGEKATVQLTVK